MSFTRDIFHPITVFQRVVLDKFRRALKEAELFADDICFVPTPAFGTDRGPAVIMEDLNHTVISLNIIFIFGC